MRLAFAKVTTTITLPPFAWKQFANTASVSLIAVFPWT